MFKSIVMAISKKENGKHVEIGKQTVFVPLLKDILPFVGSNVQMKDGKEVEEDGIPVYESKEANWIQDAILAAVKAQARNKIDNKTANLKDGQKIPENWDELTAEGVRDGSGLALAREFKTAFAEWVAKQSLSEAAANTLITLVSNKSALSVQQASTKAKVKARLEAFAESLDEATMEKFLRPLENVTKACDEVASEDF
jgi:hypothetical protein